MKSSRKLKDYPMVPSTPPPIEKKDKGLIHLEEELDREKKYLTALCMENKELEEILQNFDKEISYIKSNFADQIVGDGKVHANNEYWFKYESQVEQNRKLEREKKHLLSEIRQIEEQGMINLDSLSQSELILYVKQLERTKTDLLSDLRSKEWGLDKQAKDIHHLNEMKRALQAEIRHYDKEFALFRHYKKTSCPSASPTESRVSSVHEEKRVRLWKSKDKSKNLEQPNKTPGKRNSLSQENIAEASKADVMFSSLDESKLERMECESPTSYLGLQKKLFKGGISEKKKPADGKKGSMKKTVVIATLPELSKPRSKTPSPRMLKSKLAKGESKVGNESPKPGQQTTNKPIKIVVTYETQTTTVTQKKTAEEKTDEEEPGGVSFRSVDEIYEDDFEDSDVDKKVKKTKAVRLKAADLGGNRAKKEGRKLGAKSDVLIFESSPGTQIVITIRVIARILSDAEVPLPVKMEATADDL